MSKVLRVEHTPRGWDKPWEEEGRKVGKQMQNTHSRDRSNVLLLGMITVVTTTNHTSKQPEKGGKVPAWGSFRRLV